MSDPQALRINLLSPGDSASISTWSNLPYFLSKALIAHGVEVNRINMFPEHRIVYRLREWMWWKVDGMSKRLLHRENPPDLFRDAVMRSLVKRNIRRQLAISKPAAVNLFLTYSYSSWAIADTPVVHLGDITYAHYLEDLGRAANRRDKEAIRLEKENLEHATLILGTNDPCCQYIRDHYGIPHAATFQMGINLEWQPPDDTSAYLERKWNSRRILFIGIGIKKRGVDILIDAFNRFNAQMDQDYSLHLVGIKPEEINTDSDAIHCYGYLDKDNPEDLARYIELLESATAFVMPMREGPPPGVIKEAALTFTPVILSNIWHAEAIVDHGKTGMLVDQIDAESFAQAMASLCGNRAEWERMAIAANVYAQQWSWHNTVRKLVTHLARIGNADLPRS